MNWEKGYKTVCCFSSKWKKIPGPLLQVSFPANNRIQFGGLAWKHRTVRLFPESWRLLPFTIAPARLLKSGELIWPLEMAASVWMTSENAVIFRAESKERILNLNFETRVCRHHARFRSKSKVGSVISPIHLVCISQTQQPYYIQVQVSRQHLYIYKYI